ncbi:hypothetical protein Hanom_Chr14g01334271 [Helianthus anomalus]
MFFFLVFPHQTYILRPCIVIRVNNASILGRFPLCGSTVNKGHYWAFFLK